MRRVHAHNGTAQLLSALNVQLDVSAKLSGRGCLVEENYLSDRWRSVVLSHAAIL